MNRDETELLAFLKQAAAFGGLREGYAYRSPTDFALRHGEWFRPARPPRGAFRGVPRCCFGNAITACVLYGWRYVEGFALAPAGRLPVLHAWNVDAAGNAYDLTWPAAGLAYRGTLFSLGRADDATWNGDGCVLDDWRRGWPLLRDAWEGEDFGRDWEPSDGLVLARKLAAEKKQARTKTVRANP